MRTRVNVSAWWAALVPPRFAHRALLLTAIDSAAELAAGLFVLLEGLGRGAPCEHSQGLLMRTLHDYKALSRWAAGLDGRPGALRLHGGDELLDAAGVVAHWVGELGRVLLSHSWMPVLECAHTPAPWRIGAFRVLARLAETQHEWPWLVDSAAVATAAGVVVQAPEETASCRTDGEVLRKLLEPMGAALAVEVGVDVGATSAYLLASLPALRLVGVDPYLGVYGGVPSGERKDGLGASERFAVATGRFRAHAPRARLLRATSAVAAQNWSVGPLDLVFIDAEHDTSSCQEDIRMWAPLVRRGGVVAGDDYLAGGGVPAAVHAELPEGAALYVAPGAIWWWVKP